MLSSHVTIGYHIGQHALEYFHIPKKLYYTQLSQTPTDKASSSTNTPGTFKHLPDANVNKLAFSMYDHLDPAISHLLHLLFK